MQTKPEQGLELRKKFASMEAQLSGLQKMFCPLSESVNVNKNRVESYTCVSFSDYKPTRPTTSSPGPFPRLGGVPHTSATKPAKRPWERGCPPQTTIPTSHKKRSRRRNSLSKLLTHNTRAQNQRYIKNLSSQALSNDEVKLLSRGLKFIQPLQFPTQTNLVKGFR